MHFCPKCGNMYYLTLFDKDQTKLIYYCRNCGNEDKTLVNNLNNLFVSKTEINTQMNYKDVINKYTKLDPTLPRITNIDCPNEACKSRHMIEQKDGTELPEQEKEILYIRYDDANMKFVYLCGVCNTVWNTSTK